jgi:hypothetical protein
MSRTLINFPQCSELQTKNELENKISKFCYNFKFVSEFEKFANLNQIDFIECKLSGQQIFVQIRHSPETEIIANLTDLKIELLNKDYDISFLFRLEKIVCTSMHIILLELIDRCQSNVLQTHDKIIYTFQTLIQNISNSLKIQWLGDFQ